MPTYNKRLSSFLKMDFKNWVVQMTVRSEPLFMGTLWFIVLDLNLKLYTPLEGTISHP